MVQYFIDLGQERVNKLNRLFCESPYSVEDRKKFGFRVYFKWGKEKVDGVADAILQYDQNNFAAFLHNIQKLPLEFKEDLMNRMLNVKGLERIVKRFSD